MEFCILQPLLVRTDDGRVQHIPQPRHRAILSMLLLANKPVAPARIIQALWGASPPRAAAATLRAHISSIRRLAPFSSRLETSSVGYHVRTTGRELDLTAFREDAAAGRAALTRGEHEVAAPILQRALDYWSDPALADLPPDSELNVEAERLGRERRSVQRSWADARLVLGDHHELIPLLQAWTAGDPLDEHLWAQLMLALYRSGRQGDALAAYARVRETLLAECGVDPGRELRDLQRCILSEDQALDAPSRLLAPGALRPGSQGAAPPPGQKPGPELPAATLNCQLPPDAAHFTGRAAELAALAELLTPEFSDGGPPLVVVTGDCGSGKTALAVRSAHMLRDQFPDGQLFIPVRASINGPRPVADLLADALVTMGIPEHRLPEAPDERATLFQSRTTGRRILMVLDDCDLDVDGCGSLIPVDGRSAVVATTRRHPTDLRASRLTIGGMPAGDAQELLGRLAGRRPADITAAGQLADTCGSLPLGVRIVGASLTSSSARHDLDAAELAMRERKRLDQAGARNAAVRAAVSVGYASLDQRAAAALRLMGMIPAKDVDSWVIAALLGQHRAEDVAVCLVERGLLVSSDSYCAGRHRYRLLEPVRQHVAEYLEREPQAARLAARKRVLAGWLELADLADRSLPRPPGTLYPPRAEHRTVIPDQLAASLVRDPVAWFDAEHRGLAEAVEDAARAGDFLVAAQLIAYQTAYLYYHERLSTVVRLWQVVGRQATTMGDHAAAARARFYEAAALFQLGERDRPRSLFEASLPALEGLGDGHALALGEYFRGAAAAERGEPGKARRHAQAGLALARHFGDRLTEVLNLLMLGLAQARSGHHRLGELYCGQAVRLARTVNEPSYERLAMATLSSLAG